MNITEVNSISEIVKNTTDSFVNVWTLAEKVFPGIAIGKAIRDAHIDNINDIRNNDAYDEISRAIILSQYKQIIKQANNCERIVKWSLKDLSKDISTDVDDIDWYEFFFDKARIVSKKEFQMIWGKILARKIEGWDISKKLIHTISVIEDRNIDVFCKIAKMTFQNTNNPDAIYPLIFIKDKPSKYNDLGIYRYHLSELQNMGLIDFDIENGYVFPRNCTEIKYGDRSLLLSQGGDKRLPMGNVKITHDGQVLWSAMNMEYDYSFFDFCKQYLREQSIIQ